EWLGKTHVEVCRIKTVSSQFADCSSSKISGMSEGQYGEVAAVFQFSALANFNLLHWRFPFGAYTLAAGITDHKRKIRTVELCGVHEVTQFAFVHGCAHDHIWYTAHEGNVVGSVMGGAVFTDEAGAVQAEDDRQFLNGHIMHGLVVRAL